MKKYSIYEFSGVNKEVLENCRSEQLNSCQAWALYGNDGVLYLQSYNTIVAKIENGKGIKLGRWSVTTSKQTTQFFRKYNATC